MRSLGAWSVWALLLAAANGSAQNELAPAVVTSEAAAGLWPADAVSANAGPTWIEADYLLWWLSPAPVTAPLITTGPPASQGVLGRPGVQVLYGDSGVGLGAFSGLRVGAGAWVGTGQRFGVEAGGFLLETRSSGVGLRSDTSGAPLLATPFLGLTPAGAAETSLRSSSPGLFVGGTSVGLSSRLWGAEANGLWRGDPNGPWRLVLGFNSLSLEESLERITANDTMAALRTDRYQTQNHFYGGQVGLGGRWQSGRLVLDLVGKVALGCMHESVTLNGNLIRPDGTTLPGGILIAADTLGVHSVDRFAVMPQARAQVGYAVTERLRAFAGYSGLYASSVARPGDEIDRAVVVADIPSATSRFGATQAVAHPEFAVRSTSLWAHGVNFGLELRY